jgi:hypothetical protein
MKRIRRAAAAGIAAIVIGATPTVLHAANMKVEKTLLSASPAHPGVPIVYQIVVSNSGALAPTVNLDDDIDTKAVFDSLSAPSGWGCSTPPVGQGGTIQCSFQNMDTGASATLTLTMTILPQFLPLTISNTAVVSNSGGEDDPSDNSSTVVTPVTPSPSVPMSSAALTALGVLLAGAGVRLKS